VQCAAHLLHGTFGCRFIDVALLIDDDVGQFDDALLDRLQVVAGVRQLQQHEGVGHAGDRGFALADADRLDDDDVEAGRLAHQHRLARLFRDAAQRAGRRRRADEGVGAGRQLLHARLVAEDGAAGATTTGRPPAPPPWPFAISASPSASMKVDLPAPGTPEMPTRIDCRCAAAALRSTCAARAWWSRRVDSISVMVLASARGCRQHAVDQRLVGVGSSA
jgi:hypothetical protein